ncbi:MAG: methionyl-tRNA formyltransferase [Methyloligellaceae bacterium]
MTLRIVFMGTPDFSVPTLSALIGAGHEIAAVYTQPPRAAGRGQKERLSPVHAFARDAGLAVETPASLKQPAEQEKFRAFGADVAVVVAYGLILPQPVLSVPRHGCLNGHASLLPRWRGAAPIQRAIMAGDRETGVMIMRMEAGLDTGPVCMAERVAITPEMTAGELHDILAPLCADLMVRAIAALERDSLVCTPQPEEGVTYARKITKEETRIDWRRPAQEVHDHIRALSPVPGAWFELERDGRRERIKVLRSRLAAGSGPPGSVIGAGESLVVACASGAVRLLELQRAGKRPVAADAFLRGTPLAPGRILS